MKVSYYGYCLEFTEEGAKKRCLFNIKEILETIVNKETPLFLSGFTYLGENLYLVKEYPAQAPDTYFLLITRNNELVKTINESNISVNDIRNLIKEDEKIGTGSFIHAAHDSCVAYVSQLMSPRKDAFWHYVNAYLEKITGTNALQVIAQPLMAEETIERVMNLDHIGKTRIEVGAKNTLFRSLSQLLGNCAGEEEINNIQITINPKRSGNAKEFIRNLPNCLNNDVGSLVIRAKGELYSSLTDLFIIGSGGLSDSINPDTRDSRSIGNAIEQKMRDNQVLSGKLNKYRDLRVYEMGMPQSLLNALKGRGANVEC